MNKCYSFINDKLIACQWPDYQSTAVLFLSKKKGIKVSIRINYQILFGLVALCCLSGCGLISSQSIYEGVRGNDKAKTTGTTQKPSHLPTYDQYEKERELLKK